MNFFSTTCQSVGGGGGGGATTMTSIVDRRRNVGPEPCARPLPDPKVSPKSKVPILSESYMRHDGRYPEQLCAFSVKTGIISRAHGSAYVEAGNTKLVCAVYGPRNSATTTLRTTATRTIQTLGNVSCEINYAPFSCIERCSHQPEAEEEDMALLLLQAVCPAIRRELFPNAHVDIYITVLENDGSVLSTAITAASVSLIQAGVEMLDSVVACTTLLVPEQGIFIMDPDGKEEGEGEGKNAKILIAILPNLNQITQLYSIGKVQPELLSEAISLCADGVCALYDNSIRPVIEGLNK